ncbi:MAG: hypothetical protein QM757_36160 [Paludibaculum sp.]
MKILLLYLAFAGASFARSPYFGVHVVDEQTGRGVPLVELKLQNEVKYFTDSSGWAAFDEPSLSGRQVFVEVTSDGYEYPDKLVFGRGLMLRLEPGGRATVKIRRKMIAERLYRVTGEGIYRDSVLLGEKVPLSAPVLNGQVLGQDTATTAIYQGKLFWIWGDTIGPDFWNFSVSGATSELPGQGGLDPARGVNLHYFVEKNGRSKGMLPLPRPGLVWIEGLLTMKDPAGRERLIATYTRQDGLKPPDECGVALFDDAKAQFESWVQMPCRKSHYSAHPFRHDGFWYLYPWMRVKDDWTAIQDPARWEERKLQPPPGASRISCVVWNEFRRRWIMLVEKTGVVFYSEATAPEGPYGPMVEILRHEHYNFYNVVAHPYFAQEGGKVMYLEGTYTDAFSDAKQKTPRYNYNQVMYRLRLDDLRLQEAQR